MEKDNEQFTGKSANESGNSTIDPFVNLSLQEKSYVEQRVQSEKKSTTVAYLLWFFLGFFGAYRFYLGKSLSGILIFVAHIFSVIFTLGLGNFIIYIVEAFLIPKLEREHTAKLRRKIALEVAASKQS